MGSQHFNTLGLISTEPRVMPFRTLSGMNVTERPGTYEGMFLCLVGVSGYYSSRGRGFKAALRHLSVQGGAFPGFPRYTINRTPQPLLPVSLVYPFNKQREQSVVFKQ